MPHSKKNIARIIVLTGCVFLGTYFLAKPVIANSFTKKTVIAKPTKALTHLEKQRELYQQAQDLLDLKKIDQYIDLRPQISDYALTPYVDYRAFLIDIGERSPQEVDNFTLLHKDFPFSSSIKAAYLTGLAKNKRWKTLSEYQKESPNDQRFRCYYYTAKWETNYKTQAYKGAQSLWLTAGSVSSACDDLFDHWAKAGHRTDDMIIDRMVLMSKARRSGLFSYLDKMLVSDAAKEQSKNLQALFKKPQDVLSFSQSNPVTKFNQSLTDIAFKQWIRQDTKSAVENFDAVMKAQKLPQSTQTYLANYATSWLVNTDSDKLAAWRDAQIKQGGSVAMIERRARLAVQHNDWQGVSYWVGLLPQKMQSTTRWQYWLGRVEFAQGKDKQAKQRLTKILGQRDFYSVAAANLLGEPIRYQSQILTGKQVDISSKKVALARIEEMIAVDKIDAAKREWRWLLWHSTQSQKMALVEYASHKHWHNFTIVATIEAKMWSYTSLRFPITHRWWFEHFAKKNNVPLITLMSLSRQESALDVDARSPVGARGLMQIMPTTAQHVVDIHDLKYNNADDLYNVDKNIEIGSYYLSDLLKDYDNNRIFAFAAYNAGPNRVKQWRQRTGGKVDAYSFIEAIPFKETRGYVQNILMFETYYRNLLAQDGAFLTPSELKGKY
ncbi:transglycosylase SLT domain-containing protein [Vibrio sp. S11_S32]|uniref:transglycosylase SLT domain-containing protein n=1 Tax=Vibrio sp. S11_S32 TaxID=2720225 RepID=UPI001680B1C7|nr:transglycosylase SLT domain-containing protein [Vibrio sp. S11_S32]MBD1575373.1 transglycosylase SLT domain-containing protein [Vibrio sp. S11_S32]